MYHDLDITFSFQRCDRFSSHSQFASLLSRHIYENLAAAAAVHTYNIPHGARWVVRRMFARLTPMNRFNYFKHDLLPLLEYSDAFFSSRLLIFSTLFLFNRATKILHNEKQPAEKHFFFINKNYLSVRAAALALLL